jgi:hypothetical protein
MRAYGAANLNPFAEVRMSVRPIPRFVAACIVVVVNTGCGAVHRTDAQPVMLAGREDLPPLRHDNDRLTAKQIAATPGLSTAYSAIEHLRREFLRPTLMARAKGDNQLPDVFVNDLPSGGVETLRSIPIRLVSEIRFVRREDAYHRFGSMHAAGVILVITKQ